VRARGHYVRWGSDAVAAAVAAAAEAGQQRKPVLVFLPASAFPRSALRGPQNVGNENWQCCIWKIKNVGPTV